MKKSPKKELEAGMRPPVNRKPPPEPKRDLGVRPPENRKDDKKQ